MARLRRQYDLRKVQRYRSQRADGLKLVRLWVPDPRSPGFGEEARRQAQMLTGAPEEMEALDFIERAAAWDDASR